MIKIKEILCDIVKYTYGTNCNPQYYRFYVEISDKNSKTYHGYYDMRNGNRIVIFNTYRDDESIIVTTIHELAHHIDACNRGLSDHQKPFYEEYEKLVFTALNMRLFDKERFIDAEKDASDSNKIRKILECYEPHYIDYKQDKWVVSVYNSYAHKDYLKKQGYTYNGNLKCWEKETADKEQECEKLKTLNGIEIKCTQATDLHFNGNIKILADGNTYQYKEELKKAGFRYSNKKWIYTASDKNKITEIRQMFKENHELAFKEIK